MDTTSTTPDATPVPPAPTRPLAPAQPPAVAHATGSHVSLALSEDQATVLATFTPPPPSAASAQPGTPAVAPAVVVVHEWLKQGGWGDWWVDAPALEKWRQHIPTATQALTAPIAQRRDGRYTVAVARDRMSATLTLTRPQGGAALTLEQVQQALADKGVKAGVLPEALADAVALGEANEREVARGQAAVHGEHTRFEQLVADMAERHPHVYEDGWVDYRDLGDLVVVKAGTPLLRRVPPRRACPALTCWATPCPPNPAPAGRLHRGSKAWRPHRAMPICWWPASRANR